MLTRYLVRYAASNFSGQWWNASDIEFESYAAAKSVAETLSQACPDLFFVIKTIMKDDE